MQCCLSGKLQPSDTFCDVCDVTVPVSSTAVRWNNNHSGGTQNTKAPPPTRHADEDLHLVAYKKAMFRTLLQNSSNLTQSSPQQTHSNSYTTMLPFHTLTLVCYALVGVAALPSIPPSSELELNGQNGTIAVRGLLDRLKNQPYASSV